MNLFGLAISLWPTMDTLSLLGPDDRRNYNPGYERTCRVLGPGSLLARTDYHPAEETAGCTSSWETLPPIGERSKTYIFNVTYMYVTVPCCKAQPKDKTSKVTAPVHHQYNPQTNPSLSDFPSEYLFY